jgi:hypothetical protein
MSTPSLYMSHRGLMSRRRLTCCTVILVALLHHRQPNGHVLSRRTQKGAAVWALIHAKRVIGFRVFQNLGTQTLNPSAEGACPKLRPVQGSRRPQARTLARVYLSSARGPPHLS